VGVFRAAGRIDAGPRGGAGAAIEPVEDTVVVGVAGAAALIGEGAERRSGAAVVGVIDAVAGGIGEGLAAEHDAEAGARPEVDDAALAGAHAGSLDACHDGRRDAGAEAGAAEHTAGTAAGSEHRAAGAEIVVVTGGAEAELEIGRAGLAHRQVAEQRERVGSRAPRWTGAGIGRREPELALQRQSVWQPDAQAHGPADAGFEVGGIVEGGNGSGRTHSDEIPALLCFEGQGADGPAQDEGGDAPGDSAGSHDSYRYAAPEPGTRRHITAAGILGRVSGPRYDSARRPCSLIPGGLRERPHRILR